MGFWDRLRKELKRRSPWLADHERRRLRSTGRDVYGEYPYVKTDEEEDEWQKAKREEKPEEAEEIPVEKEEEKEEPEREEGVEEEAEEE